jgi:hypothetical protein
MPKPVAILISDIHYNLQTLKLADAAMRMAIHKANSLGVPLIVAGDLHDTKANLRGECVNAMVKTFNRCETSTHIIIGNHDKLNEKSDHNMHSLHFLRFARNLVVDKPFLFVTKTKILYLLPYYHDADELRSELKIIPKGSTIIMHQGLQGSNMGDYFQDKSALNHEDVADFRVISGHYHQRQDIKTGRPQKGGVGMFSYIGNPYTTSYGEANDPLKGFQVLMDDGSLEFIPTNLRKHRVVKCGWDKRHNLFWGPVFKLNETDLNWIKIEGTHEQLATMSRAKVAEMFGINTFKLDLIPLSTKSDQIITKIVSNWALYDALIDNLTNTSDERKLRLKELYKQLGS